MSLFQTQEGLDLSDPFGKISGSEPVQVLRNLSAADGQFRARILAEVQAVLEHIDRDEAVGEVFFDLDMLDVEELCDRSGSHRYGYSTPDEVTFEMFLHFLVRSWFLHAHILQ